MMNTNALTPKLLPLLSPSELRYYFSKPELLKDESRILDTLDPLAENDRILEKYEPKFKIKEGKVLISYEEVKSDELFKRNPLRWIYLITYFWFLKNGNLPKFQVYLEENSNDYNLVEFKDLGLNIGNHLIIKGFIRRTTTSMTAVIANNYICRACAQTIKVTRCWYEKLARVNCVCGAKIENIIENPEGRVFETWQSIVLQESGDNEIGQNINVRILDPQLFDKFLPGEQVLIHGFIDMQVKDSAQNKLYLDAIDIVPSVKKELTVSSRDIEFYHQTLKNSKNYWDALKFEFFPQLYGLDLAKDAIMLQIFQGAEVKAKRSNIHVLLVGNPSSGKSALLRSVHKITQGVRVSGMGSTSAGLTATAYKDANGAWCLDGGALVSSSRKMVLLDELDKLPKIGQEALLEAMEQQTISISKAGLNVTLPAKCSVLAACNPKLSSKFNKEEPFIEQLGLTRPLLSRFDLLVVTGDEDRAAYEDQMVQGIMKGRCKDEFEQENLDKSFIFGSDFLGYLSYARSLKPTISKELQEEISKHYINTKKKYHGFKDLPFDVRQLQGMVRLAQAKCKSRLGAVVSIEDWDFVKKIIEKTLKQLTNQDEEDKLKEGMFFSVSEILDSRVSKKEELLINLIKKVIQNKKDKKLNLEKCFIAVSELEPNTTKKDFEKCFRILVDSCIVYKPDGFNIELVYPNRP